MAIDFPTAPTIGQLHPDPAVVGVPQYEWDGSVWVARVDDTLTYVKRSGDTMTGHLALPITPAAANAVRKDFVVAKAGGADGIMSGLLTLSGDPTAAMHAATKQYVDGQGVIKIKAWTASATYTPDPNLICAIVEVQGGGGAGGGAVGNTGFTLTGGGGGAGGYTRKVFTAAEIGASVAVTIGAGGIGTTGSGGNGGTSSFLTLSATGGGGGLQSTTGSMGTGGAGGTGSGGPFGLVGQHGFNGFYWASSATLMLPNGGIGGSSVFGGGGRNNAANNNVSTGSAGTGVGSGGGGGSTHNVFNTSVGGGGSVGMVVVTELCKR